MFAEKQHAQLRQALTQAPGGFQAADAGQVEVHDYQAGQFLLHLLQGLLAAAGLANWQAIEPFAQKVGQAQADHRVVVDQQDAHRAVLL